MSKAICVGMSKMRRDIGRIKWGYVSYSFLQYIQFQRAKDLGLSVLVDVEGGNDLVPVTLWEAQDKSFVEIAANLNEQVQKTKKKQNTEHNEVTKIFTILPTYVLGFLSTACSYLAQNVGISIKALNLKANAFGHMVLTNVGTLGH